MARAEVVEFSERSADIGQEFQNHYEATKYMAEQLVQGFRAAGGHGYIYRSGNVSGHSLTARFQKNARDNRFIQFLAACVKAGQLPRHLGEPIVLSPIDEVAAGVVAISLDSHLSGGVFHVDSDHEVPIEQVFEALKRAGIEFQASEHASFATLFSDLCEVGDAERRDPELALGFFWATRKPRNVRFSNAQTLALMSRLGCSFSQARPGVGRPLHRRAGHERRVRCAATERRVACAPADDVGATAGLGLEKWNEPFYPSYSDTAGGTAIVPPAHLRYH